MNQQTIKMLKAGIFAGALAAIIEIIISAALTVHLGKNIESAQLFLGGLTIGAITFVLTLIISTVIARRKQKI